MRNGAHASDSAENAQRERKIIGLAKDSETEKSDFVDAIREFLAS